MLTHIKTRTLSNTPQRLGVLPSMWFWRRMNRDLSRQTLLTINTLGMVQGLTVGYVLFAWLDLSGAAQLASALAAFGLSLVQMGLLERWLRKKVSEKALHSEATSTQALKP